MKLLLISHSQESYKLHASNCDSFKNFRQEKLSYPSGRFFCLLRDNLMIFKDVWLLSSGAVYGGPAHSNPRLIISKNLMIRQNFFKQHSKNK